MKTEIFDFLFYRGSTTSNQIEDLGFVGTQMVRALKYGEVAQMVRAQDS